MWYLPMAEIEKKEIYLLKKRDQTTLISVSEIAGFFVFSSEIETKLSKNRSKIKMLEGIAVCDKYG